ncbi:MAG: L-2-hydroxyglutarate oxidase LhgO [Bacteriovoracaceae bacterium]|jgi:L-2-hydroxyglutarate oxidase LhgO
MKLDAVIIGGGIVGLTIARYYSEKFPSDIIALFESSDFLGEGNTSRNSGVLHAGLYYETGSQKHQFCVRGNQIWRKWKDEFDMDVTICGKYLVASTQSEIASLEDLYGQALKNNIPDVSWISSEKIDHVAKVEKCFFSGTTGYINVPEAIKKLELLLLKKDIPIFLKNKVENIEKIEDGFKIKTSREEFESKRVFNAAGFGAIELRKKLDLTEFENVFVKGNYLRVKKKYFNESLIYPVPLKNLKGLGVHTTIDSGGVVRFGPNAIDVDSYDYKVNEDSVKQMWPEIRALFKGLKKDDLMIDYAGVRTKLAKNGATYKDFHVSAPIEGYFEAIGIESPGLTSAPAIAEFLVDKI